MKNIINFSFYLEPDNESKPFILFSFFSNVKSIINLLNPKIILKFSF
jgi:hypothetical protein